MLKIKSVKMSINFKLNNKRAIYLKTEKESVKTNLKENKV